MELNYRPSFLISANGDDITARIQSAFHDITLVDHSGTESDSMTLTLDGCKIGKLPPKGALLRISFGLNGTYVKQGAWTVDSVEISGWPEIVTITGHSIPMQSADKPGASIQSQRSQSWSEVTFEDLLKTVSARNKLNPIISDKLGQITFDHIDQTSESDMAMLNRLARMHGVVSKISNESWMILAEGEGKNASGTKDRPVLIVNASQCDPSKTRYKSNSRTSISSTVAKWHNVETGKTGVERAGSGEPVFEIIYPFPNQAEAIAAVKAKSKQVKSGSDTFTCSPVISVPLLSAFAEGHLKAVGWRPEIADVTWRIKTVTKSLSKSSGLLISFDCDSGASKK